MKCSVCQETCCDSWGGFSTYEFVAELNARTVMHSSVVNVANKISVWTVCRISGVKNVNVTLRQTVWIVRLRVLEM